MALLLLSILAVGGSEDLIWYAFNERRNLSGSCVGSVTVKITIATQDYEFTESKYFTKNSRVQFLFHNGTIGGGTSVATASDQSGGGSGT